MKLCHISRLFCNYSTVMSTSKIASLVPFGVRGMKVLDREKFLRNIRVPILRVPEDKLSKITPICKPYLLKLERFKAVQDYTCEQYDVFKKCIYFNPEKLQAWTDFSDQEQCVFQQHGIYEINFDTKEVQLTYDNWKFDTIFKAVLPEEEEIVSSFSQIGHIIHLNLREHLLDYRSLIGQVLLDKIKTCRTVVNKSNIIDNTYRNFSMEIIAGEEDFLVTVKENRCTFQFDFSKVYWNPRLGKEHERILSYLKAGDVLFDIFCGVGPFSIPAAKKKCKVYANDLNPDSYKWLNHNADSNKVNKSLFMSCNQDGKDFICNIFKNYIIQLCNGQVKLDYDARIHITMNLPAMAVQFLKYFKDLIQNNEIQNEINCEIIVYVYCFAIGDDPMSVAKQMVSENMAMDMSPYIMDVFNVRNVSPKKEMVRVTFRLTKDILCNNNKLESDNEPPNKKICI